MVKLHILSSQIKELQYYYLDDDFVVISSHFYQNLLTNKNRNCSFEGNSPGSAYLQYLQAKYSDTIHYYFLKALLFSYFYLYMFRSLFLVNQATEYTFLQASADNRTYATQYI